MARFVAAVWGNVGPGLAPWHIDAGPFLTDQLARDVAAIRPLSEDVKVRSQVIAATASDSRLTLRASVTLEQTLSIDGTVEQHTTLTVVELVLVADEPGWLVGSLERLA